MPSETLHLHYRRDYRQNRRRPKHPILQAIVRLTLLIVALGIVIGVLMRLGFIEEPESDPQAYFHSAHSRTPQPDPHFPNSSPGSGITHENQAKTPSILSLREESPKEHHSSV